MEANISFISHICHGHLSVGMIMMIKLIKVENELVSVGLLVYDLNFAVLASDKIRSSARIC